MERPTGVGGVDHDNLWVAHYVVDQPDVISRPTNNEVGDLLKVERLHRHYLIVLHSQEGGERHTIALSQ